MPCWPSGHPLISFHANFTSSSVVDGCHATNEGLSDVMTRLPRGVSGSETCPVRSNLVVVSQSTDGIGSATIEGIPLASLKPSVPAVTIQSLV